MYRKQSIFLSPIYYRPLIWKLYSISDNKQIKSFIKMSNEFPFSVAIQSISQHGPVLCLVIYTMENLEFFSFLRSQNINLNRHTFFHHVYFFLFFASSFAFSFFLPRFLSFFVFLVFFRIFSFHSFLRFQPSFGWLCASHCSRWYHIFPKRNAFKGFHRNYLLPEIPHPTHWHASNHNQ